MFTKANTKFCLCLYYNADNKYMFINSKEIFKFKANKKKLVFRLDFV